MVLTCLTRVQIWLVFLTAFFFPMCFPNCLVLSFVRCFCCLVYFTFFDFDVSIWLCLTFCKSKILALPYYEIWWKSFWTWLITDPSGTSFQTARPTDDRSVIRKRDPRWRVKDGQSCPCKTTYTRTSILPSGFLLDPPLWSDCWGNQFVTLRHSLKSTGLVLTRSVWLVLVCGCWRARHCRLELPRPVACWALMSTVQCLGSKCLTDGLADLGCLRSTGTSIDSLVIFYMI